MTNRFTAPPPRPSPIRWAREQLSARLLHIESALNVEAGTPALPDEPAELIDTSKMSAGQRAALELTEAARDNVGGGSFASRLFMGQLDLSGITPFPEQTAEDRDQGDAFLQRLEKFLRE